MKNKSAIWITGITIVLLLLVAFLFRDKKTRFDWRETYQVESKEPYGTHIISELIRTYFPGEDLTVLKDSLRGHLPAEQSQSANYVFIGEALFMDTADTQSLLEFVSKGNQAFISSRTIPFDLMFEIYYLECYDKPWDDYLWVADTSVTLGFDHPDLAREEGFLFSHITKHKVNLYNWSYIEGDYFCEEEYSGAALGRINDSLVNFVRYKYGEGEFYLHTTPLAFSNIQLLDEEGFQYASKVFSHLTPGPVYWDEYSKVSEMVGRNNNRQHSRQNYRGLSAESPLQYILSQPALAWAWYLLLAMGLLFLIFRTRRKQRVIPVLEKNTNTSMDFITTIGRLYFMQNKHRQLALQKIRLFQGFVRERYHMQARNWDEEMIRKLVLRSEIPEDHIRKIAIMASNIESSKIMTANTLVAFHKLIDYFYKNCK